MLQVAVSELHSFNHILSRSPIRKVFNLTYYLYMYFYIPLVEKTAEERI